MDEKSTLIVGLILLSIGLCYTIAQLFHRLRLSNKENEHLIKKNSESEHNLQNKISELQKENSRLEKERSKTNQGHVREVRAFKSAYMEEISNLENANSILNKQLSDMKRKSHLKDVKETNESVPGDRVFKPEDDFS